MSGMGDLSLELDMCISNEDGECVITKIVPGAAGVRNFISKPSPACFDDCKKKGVGFTPESSTKNCCGDEFRVGSGCREPSSAELLDGNVQEHLGGGETYTTSGDSCVCCEGSPPVSLVRNATLAPSECQLYALSVQPLQSKHLSPGDNWREVEDTSSKRQCVEGGALLRASDMLMGWGEEEEIQKRLNDFSSSGTYPPFGGSFLTSLTTPSPGYNRDELSWGSSGNETCDGSGGKTVSRITQLLAGALKGNACSPSPSKKVLPRGARDWEKMMKNGEGMDVDRQKVVQAIYTFEQYRQTFIEVEEARAATCKLKGQPCRERPDLRASKQMTLEGLRVNTDQFIGNVPGVKVGDQFWYRVEMVMVGLHQQTEAGIAYVSKHKLACGVALATSIVMKTDAANPYQDDEDKGDFITYTGQGGLSCRSGNAHHIADQELKRGNEALKNSFERTFPIRVIRGEKDKKSPTGESYIYIGLYKIVNMRYEPGVDGRFVYKFDLRRMEGQAALPPSAASQAQIENSSPQYASSAMCVKGQATSSPCSSSPPMAQNQYASGKSGSSLIPHARGQLKGPAKGQAALSPLFVSPTAQIQDGGQITSLVLVVKGQAALSPLSVGSPLAATDSLSGRRAESALPALPALFTESPPTAQTQDASEQETSSAMIVGSYHLHSQDLGKSC